MPILMFVCFLFSRYELVGDRQTEGPTRRVMWPADGCVIIVTTVWVFIVVLAVCEDKEEIGGCKSDFRPCCFFVSPVSQMCPYFVWLDVTHI